MLEVKNITLTYDNLVIVKDVNITIKKGDVLVVVGASGCGKTTLLKAIGGFKNIHKGSVSFDGEKIKTPEEQLVPGHDEIKLVNQDFNLDDFHTVEENIKLRLLQFDKDYKNQRTEILLGLIGLKKDRYKKAKNLSGGQKQRLAIARALADEPELLLLDEPFNQLDFHLKQKIQKYIIDYVKKYKITTVLVTHNGEEAMRWANQIAFMKNGKIRRIDVADNYYHFPSNKYEASFFGKINTVVIDNKEVSFRPNDYKLDKSKTYNLKLNLTFDTTIFKGWYNEYVFKFGRRKISLYNQIDISHLTEIWIKKVEFKA